jgi:membrane fusion protein, copper/silver efflux system
MKKAALLALLVALPALAADQATPAPAAGKTIEIKVTDAGFEPREIKLKRGEAVTLVFTRTTDQTCITAVDIPGEKVKDFQLPLNKPVSLTLKPMKAGTQPFHCSAMAMGNGKLIVQD